MAKVVIWQNGESRELTYAGALPLHNALEQCGLAVAHPCGGRGTCGKCAVQVTGEVSELTDAEKKAGTRLSCQTVLLGDAVVILPDTKKVSQIETSGVEAGGQWKPMEGTYGAAVDIGTTTVALKLVDLKAGAVLAEAGMLNPQTGVAADVMGRISAAMNGEGEKLRSQITQAIGELIAEACGHAGVAEELVDVMVLTGNTTMLYLLTGRNPEPLSHAPFQADELFGMETEILGRRTYLPPCMNAFVGADITCAVQASGMCGREETTLLCDIGTNGEIALWKDGKLYVTSTAAGPAFEGAGISCGCGSVIGAVDKVWVEDGELCAHTIGEQPAVGVCGSGLIDAIAAFLEVELVDETGASDEDELMLRDGIYLVPKDVRAVQVAKAAISAGIQTLMTLANTSVDQICTLYIAGGFGSHLNVTSAARIGLIPEELANKVSVIGNASLSGALGMLRNRDAVEEAQRIAANTSHVNLGGNPLFSENYMEQMLFPESE